MPHARFRDVSGGTSVFNRHVRSLLQRFFTFSRDENTFRTWARTSQGSKSPNFPLSHVSCSIRLITSRPLLLPNSSCRHSSSMPCGSPAMPCAWRRDSLSTFHMSNHNEHRRSRLDAGGATVPCRYVRHLQPDHIMHTQGCMLRPASPRRSVLPLTARAGFQLI